MICNWSEHIIQAIHDFNGKAWRFFNDDDFAKGYCYLPSRIRRCILEVAGEILRSQHKRMELFYAIRGALKDDEHGLDTVDEEDLSLAISVRRNILNYVAREGRWPENFTDLGIPELKSAFLTYSPDDGQAIEMSRDGNHLKVRIKLPLSERPTRGEWKWFSFESHMPGRVKEAISSGGRLLKPRLRAIRTKSGLVKYVLDIIIEIPDGEKTNSDVFLAVDVGVRKIATMVAMNTGGEQLTRPIFVKTRLLGKLLRLKKKIEALQSKLSKLPENSMRHAHLYAELKRCWNKIRRIHYQIKHHTSSIIVRVAREFNASSIVFENLRSFEAEGRKGKLNYLLNNEFFRTLFKYVEYKARRYGIRVAVVDAWKTSKYCPRCGEEGYHIKAPQLLKPYSGGAYFFCPNCNYRADRDYVGALNVGRAYLAGGRLSKNTKGAVYTTAPRPTGGRSPVGALPSGYAHTAPVSISPWSFIACSGGDGAEMIRLSMKVPKSSSKMERPGRRRI